MVSLVWLLVSVLKAVDLIEDPGTLAAPAQPCKPPLVSWPAAEARKWVERLKGWQEATSSSSQPAVLRQSTRNCSYVILHKPLELCMYAKLMARTACPVH